MKTKINREHLVSLYWGQGHSVREIACIIGLGPTTTFELFKKHSINLRTKKEASNTQRFLDRCRARTGGSNPYFGKRHNAKTREILSALKTMVNPKARGSWHKRARKAWTGMRGAISAGMLIHHIDGNYKNNCPDNLAMITRARHNTIHKTKAVKS